MEECIFCNIVTGRIPSRKIWENEQIIAFLNINPLADGHVLVIPKIHYKNLIETPPEVVSNLFVHTHKLMPHIKEAMQSDFVALLVMGIDVPHVHIHIIPQKIDDSFSRFLPVKKYEGEEIDSIAQKIREHVQF